MREVSYAPSGDAGAVAEEYLLLLSGDRCNTFEHPLWHNSPRSTAVTIEVLGHQLQFSQDPNSKHLGATVWDASVVFVKFLEKNSRKGRFCPNKLKGKHAIELGAGCGLAGFGMALLGCDVVSTDQVEVLPLLTRNIERNTSRVKQTNPEATLGSIRVEELDWGNPDHIRAVDPPFDYIIGTDIVYAEHLLEPLLKTIFALSGPKTTLLLGYEIRSTTLHDQMIHMWKSNFEVKTIPETKMDNKYRHPSTHLYMMGLKAQAGWREHKTGGEQSDECRGEEEEAAVAANSGGVAHAEGNRMLTDWEARRMGSMAARLLRDIKITDGK